MIKCLTELAACLTCSSFPPEVTYFQIVMKNTTIDAQNTANTAIAKIVNMMKGTLYSEPSVT